jgi:cytochrome c-type biogenesis protein CcmH
MNRLISAIFAVFLITGLSVGQGLAVQPDEMLSNPKLEHRAREISQQLRCLVCQNQSIDDSNADLARDLRIIVRQRLVAGDTDEQVIQYIVDRYGDYVLLKPPLKAATYLLWFGPAFLLLIAGGSLLVVARRRRIGTPARKLSEEEKERLAQLLNSGGEA